MTRASKTPFALLLALALGTACGGSSDPETSADGAPGDGPAAVDGSVPDGPVEGSPDASPPDAAPPEHGLHAQYFRKYGQLVLERTDAVVDFTWADGTGPADAVGTDYFAVRWSGTLDVPTAGAYKLITNNDDGVRVRVNGTLVVDDWTFHFASRHEGTITLPAGPTPIVVEYFDKDLAADAHLSWSSSAAGIAEEIIPSERLSPAGASSSTASPLPPYDNPVVNHDCPDPGVLAVPPTPPATRPTYYMACTGGHFYIKKSDDLVLWEETNKPILPDGKPPWAANGGRNWAPEIHAVGSGYVAYFTAADGGNKLAIGAAYASSPTGPFTDVGAPLVQDPLGVIDATFFHDDDGKNYLVYKIDGNSAGQPTPIFARELSADGRSFAPGSTRHQLLVNQSNTWEGGVIEAPWVVKHDGKYYVFYSGNVYDSRYRTGVARASSIFGPYEKKGDPILANNDKWVGPGHGSVVSVGNADYFVYHAWKAAAGGGQDNSAGRQGLVDRIVWDNGWPRISDGTPSRGLNPWPGAQ